MIGEAGVIKKVDHIGVAVRSIEESARIYTEGLGITLGHIENVPQDKVRVGFLPIGESEIELVQPTDPTSTVAGFIEKRGEGVHHICLEVDNIDETINSLAEQGFALIDKQARPGSSGRRIAFLHPKAANGVLIELSQKP